MNHNNNNPTSNMPIKIALIGCGRISEKHIQAIACQGANAQISAICDIDHERISKAKELINNVFKNQNQLNKEISIFNQYDEFIQAVKKEEIEIDLIVLTTPSGLHPKQTVMAAEVGLNVCTEKPMATSWQDGVSMVKACEENKVKLFVVKQNRFNQTLQLLKRQIDKDRFGKLAIINVNVFWQRPQEYYDQDAWRGTSTLDGGALMNQASHYVDLLNWLVGPVESVNCSVATISRKIEVEDTAALKLELSNGALATMAVTMLAYPENFEGSITILGENGIVRVGGKALNSIDHWSFADNTDDDLKAKESCYLPKNVYGLGHSPYYKNMINSLYGKEKTICDGREGLKSLELIIASYLSSKYKKTIKIPFDKENYI
tara:strand:+ start:699 stop:1826 length:1128 start_codon:yes stop_codon:yes gene_type:complete